MNSYAFNIFANHSSISIMVMEEFHDFTMMILTMITTFIMLMILQIFKSKFSNYMFKENTNLEVFWTILPMIILFFIAYPSIYYLYLFDLNMNPSISVKIIGAQWYWIYEFMSQESGYSYSSYMLSDLDILKEDKYKVAWRLLETDTRLIVPTFLETQCVTTSMDVIHSFSIPELGVKIDAVPGRLNSINFTVTRPGVFFGQCSEICGTGHSFMPICMESI